MPNTSESSGKISGSTTPTSSSTSSQPSSSAGMPLGAPILRGHGCPLRTDTTGTPDRTYASALFINRPSSNRLKNNRQGTLKKTEYILMKANCAQYAGRVARHLAFNPAFTRHSGRGGHRALAPSREEGPKL